MNKLIREIGSDYDQFQNELVMELKRRTPKDTGFASSNWKETNQLSDLVKTGRTRSFIENKVPYIQRLDEGWSQQAPEGFVKDAINAAIARHRGRGIITRK